MSTLCCSAIFIPQVLRSTLRYAASKPRHDVYYSRCIAVVSVLFLCGCSIPGIRWEDTDILDPPLASGQPTKQVHRCDVVTSHSGWASTGHFNRCDVAFRSGDGTQVDAFGVQRNISAALPRALPLKPLLEQFRSANRGSSKSFQDYWLYLVAINPVVVIGVPKKSGDPFCSAPGWKKCFTATELYQLDQRYAQRTSFTVYYNAQPPVRDGAFVLVPEWQNESVPLSAEEPIATISDKGMVLTFVQRGNTWRLSGSKP